MFFFKKKKKLAYTLDAINSILPPTLFFFFWFLLQVRNVIPQHQQYERRRDDEHVRDLSAKVDSALAQLRVMDDAEGAQDTSTESSVTYDDDGRTAGRNAISLEARQRMTLALKHEEQDLHSAKDISDLRSQIGSLNDKVIANHPQKSYSYRVY